MNENNKTRDFLIEYCRKYPKLQTQDLLKALHQSVFGCGHLVSDKALAFLYDELNEAKDSALSEIEALDGDFSRVSISYLKSHGLSAETFFRLFVMSSKMPCGDSVLIEKKLEILLELAQTGQLPISYDEVKTAVEDWKKSNYSACRHSESFRNTYSPAYRVIHNYFIIWLPLFSAIDKRLNSSDHVLVAIEGGSASGKTTLSELLSKIYDCNVLHMDDFFLRPEQRTEERLNAPGGNIDSERFLDEVLIPLSKRQSVSYARFDCSTQRILSPTDILPKQLNIIEGAYSMHPALAKYYDFTIFLNIDKNLQEARILKRNSQSMQKRFFDEWIPMEEKYFKTFNIINQCDISLEIKDE